MKINVPEIFPSLNFEKLQKVVLNWMQFYRHIHFTNVALYKKGPRQDFQFYNSDINTKFGYVLVFETLDYDCYTYEFYEFRNSISGTKRKKIEDKIGNELKNVYKDPLPPDYDFWEQWFFYLVTRNRMNVLSCYSNSSCNDLEPDVLIHHDHWILYKNEKLKKDTRNVELDQRLEALRKKVESDIHQFDSPDIFLGSMELSLPPVGDRLELLKKPKLEFEKAWHQYLLENSIPAQVSTEATLNVHQNIEVGNKNSFKISGDIVFINFNGHEKCCFTLNNGFKYLQYLVSNKNKEIDVENLDIDINPRPGIENSFFYQNDLSYISENTIKEKILDHKAFEEYKKKISELEEGINEAEVNNDIMRKEKLQNELEFIKNELYDNHQKSKKNPRRESIRSKVGQSLTKAIKKIRDHNPDLADHFERSIPRKNSVTLVYRPNPDVDWVVE